MDGAHALRNFPSFSRTHGGAARAPGKRGQSRRNSRSSAGNGRRRDQVFLISDFAQEAFMADKVKTVSQGFPTLNPHLTLRDAGPATRFYHKAFGAEVICVPDGPQGKVMYAR